MNIIKRFLEWIKLKEKLHRATFKPPLVAEGEVWWASMGENIGREISGKSELFSRPVLVFKKLSRETFLALPTTTQERHGSWYVRITYGKYDVSIVLSQARVLDTKRLSSRLGQVNEEDFRKIQEGFVALYIPKKVPLRQRRSGRGKSPK